MTYLIYGENSKKPRERAQDILKSFEKKYPEAGVFEVGPEDFNKHKFKELMGGQTLFSGKYLVYCNNLFQNKEAEEFVKEMIKEVSSSPNIFVFLEDDLDKKLETIFKKEGAKIEKFESLEKSAKGFVFNVFSLTDALGEKDRKKLWVLYEKAKRSGLSPEVDIFWKFVWQIKNLSAVKLSPKYGRNSVSKLKLKPFVLNRTESYVRNFTEAELKKMYGELVRIYHSSRRGIGDFELGLEKFILNLPKRS